MVATFTQVNLLHNSNFTLPYFTSTHHFHNILHPSPNSSLFFLVSSPHFHTRLQNTRLFPHYALATADSRGSVVVTSSKAVPLNWIRIYPINMCPHSIPTPISQSKYPSILFIPLCSTPVPRLPTLLPCFRNKLVELSLRHRTVYLTHSRNIKVRKVIRGSLQ